MGKVRRIPKGSRGTPKVTQISQGRAFTISLADLRQEFLGELRASGNRSAGTTWTYGVRLEYFERETGIKNLDELTRPVVVKFLGDLRAGTLPDSRKAGSDAYVANHWRHLVGFLKWCVRRGYPVDPTLFDQDPFTGRTHFSLPEPKVDEQNIKYFTDEEIANIRMAAQSMGPREALAVEMLLRTGIRLSECLNLNCDDVLGGNLRVESWERGGALRLNRTKKRKLRFPPLPTAVRNQIDSYVKRYRPASESDRLWLRKDNGQPLSKDGFEQMLDRIHKRAGVTGRAHRYRHTFATAWLRRNPGQIEKLREIMGHESYQMLRRYARLAAQDLSRNIDEEDPFA